VLKNSPSLALRVGVNSAHSDYQKAVD
jgi:hypothetical protein